MGYYAAGGYYPGGGLFSKIKKAAKKLAKSPLGGTLLKAGLGFVPGGSTIVAGLDTFKQVTKSGPRAAVQESQAGTPGAVAQHGGRRMRRLRRPRRRSYA